MSAGHGGACFRRLRCKRNHSVCGSNGATVTPGSVLTIRGYAFDLDTLDRPADPAKGQIILRNEDTLLTYRVPIQRIEARPDAVERSLGAITPEQYPLVNAGSLRRCFLLLPPGYYSVQEVKVSMQSGAVLTLLMENAEQRGSFVNDGGSSPFQLVKKRRRHRSL